MTKDKARKWIEKEVRQELLETRTLASPCEEIIDHFQANPQDRPTLIEALRDFMSNQQFTKLEQAENTADLVVNFRDRGLLNLLVSRLTEDEAPDTLYVQSAMAAIRRFSAFDPDREEVASQGKSDFLPFLIDRLREKQHASFAYEILSEFYPQDMISYFLWILGHHSNNLELLQRMLATLYFDRRKETPRSFTLEVIRDLWSQLETAVLEHPHLPEDAKSRFPRIEGVRRDLEAKLDANVQQVEARIAAHVLQAEQLEKKLIQREGQLNKMDQTVHELSVAHDRTKEVIRALRAEHEDNRERTLEMRTRLSNRDQQLKEAGTTLLRRQEDATAKDRQIQSLTEETKKASQTIKNLRSNLEAQTRRMNELEAALDRTHDPLEKATACGRVGE